MKHTSTRHRITHLMQANGVNANMLAKLSGVPANTIRDFVAGRTDTTTGKADAMIEALLRYPRAAASAASRV